MVICFRYKTEEELLSRIIGNGNNDVALLNFLLFGGNTIYQSMPKPVPSSALMDSWLSSTEKT